MYETTLLLAGGLAPAAIAIAHYSARIARARAAEDAAGTDPLTGLRNRRYLAQTISPDAALALRRQPVMRLLQGRARRDADLGFFLIDLDGFKVVNDTWGHRAGDIVLAELAQALRRACRDSDVIARWGGDEFLVVTRFADRGEAHATAERIRAAVGSYDVELAAGLSSVRLSCSVGYASYPFDLREPEALGWTDVITLADHAMYAAKRDGRDRVAGLVSGEVPLRVDRAHAPPVERADIEQWMAEQRIAAAAPPPTTFTAPTTPTMPDAPVTPIAAGVPVRGRRDGRFGAAPPVLTCA